MLKPLPPNPYIDLRLNALAEVLGERAGDLLEGRQAGRRDVAYLLLAAAFVVRPRRAHPGDPSRLVTEGVMTPLEAFAGVLRAEQKALRYWVFRQAVDAAGGVVAGPAHDAMAAKAQASDEGLLEVLGQLGRREDLAARRSARDD